MLIAILLEHDHMKSVVTRLWGVYVYMFVHTRMCACAHGSAVALRSPRAGLKDCEC